MDKLELRKAHQIAKKRGAARFSRMYSDKILPIKVKNRLKETMITEEYCRLIIHAD